MKLYSTKEILEYLFGHSSFAGVKRKNKKFFPQTFSSYKKTKELLSKINESAQNLKFPYNELLSLITQKEYWTKEELETIDKHFSEQVKRILVKNFSSEL